VAVAGPVLVPAEPVEVEPPLAVVVVPPAVELAPEAVVPAFGEPLGADVCVLELAQPPMIAAASAVSARRITLPRT
jgi:hypothetical protein